MFEQYAWADKIELPAGRRSSTWRSSELVDRYKMRGQDFRQEVHGCERRHPGTDMAATAGTTGRPGSPPTRWPGITWDQKVEIIMAEFWSRIWDEHALDHFRQHFAEYGLGGQALARASHAQVHR